MNGFNCCCCKGEHRTKKIDQTKEQRLEKNLVFGVKDVVVVEQAASTEQATISENIWQRGIQIFDFSQNQKKYFFRFLVIFTISDNFLSHFGKIKKLSFEPNSSSAVVFQMLNNSLFKF